KAPFLPDSNDRISCPPLNKWLTELKASPVVGEPGDFKPLILDKKNRLYLHRYWSYENELAQALRGRIGETSVDGNILRSGLNRLFPGNSKPDWQKVAAFTALTRRLTIISGGPGTGKTSTVLKILALLLEQGKRLRIALTAPTGKAASRLQETIKSARQKLDCAEEIRTLIPENASTIHRLLGVKRHSPFFKHDANNPLPVDVVVIDEASMVDLALMAKLFAAIPLSARVILLGDKDQLSSVEAGAVLADICDGAEPNRFSTQYCENYTSITGEPLPPDIIGGNNLLSDCIVELRKNFRFGDESPIYRASMAVRSGEAATLQRLLELQNIELQWLPELRFNDDFKQRIICGFETFLKAPDHTEALAHINDFRVLAALREGHYGVVELNRRIERILRDRGLINNSAQFYHGRPFMVTRNDYTLNLFNGDTGIIRRDRQAGEFRALFLNSDNTVRSLLPIRLPQHETVFAMTIHKSQGSEFNQVLIVLPDGDNPILTRELIYTGVSRARKTVTLVGSKHVLETALSRRVERSSGLRDKLWNP
ncbi:MAG: exodeoxyribonuclease V subunit alpha, partial [Limisphaerales bacterium]